MNEMSRQDVISASIADAVYEASVGLNIDKSFFDAIPENRIDGVEWQLGSADGIILNCALKMKVVRARDIPSLNGVRGSNPGVAYIWSPQDAFTMGGTSLKVINPTSPGLNWYKTELQDCDNFEIVGVISDDENIEFKEKAQLEIKEAIEGRNIRLFKCGDGGERPVGCCTLLIQSLTRGAILDTRGTEIGYKYSEYVKKTIGPKKNVLVAYYGKQATIDKIYDSALILSGYCDTMVVIVLGHTGRIFMLDEYVIARDRWKIDPFTGERFLDKVIRDSDKEIMYPFNVSEGVDFRGTTTAAVWDNYGDSPANLFLIQLLLNCTNAKKRIIFICDGCHTGGISKWLESEVGKDALIMRGSPSILSLVASRHDRRSYTQSKGTVFSVELLDRINEFNGSYTYSMAINDNVLNNRIKDASKGIRESTALEGDGQSEEMPFPFVTYISPGDDESVFNVPFFKE